MDERPSFGWSPAGNPLFGMQRIRLPVASMGAVMALAIALGGLLAALQHGAGRPFWLSVLAGAAGGAVALRSPERLGALAVAGGLLAVAVLTTFYGFGFLFLLPLLAILLATLDAPSRRPAPTSTVATSFAAGPPVRSSWITHRAASLRRAMADDDESEPAA
jgi:hypothetical protein